jgi:hypothetical protein
MQKKYGKGVCHKMSVSTYIVTKRVQLYHRGKKDDTESGASTDELLCWQLLLHGKIRNKTI